MPPIVITLFAEKGGTGKSTLSWNLACALARRGHRVLAVDADKQGNLSKSALAQEKVLSLHPDNTLSAVFDERTVAMPDQLLHPAGQSGLFVVPANRSLRDHLVPPGPARDRLRWRLREFLQDAAVGFAFVIVDTSPDVDGLPAVAALLASDYVVSPQEPACYSLQSLPGVQLQLDQAQALRPGLEFLGFVFNRLDGRRKHHALWIAAARRQLGDRVFATEVPALEPFARAAESRLPVAWRPGRCRAKQVLEAFTDEVLARVDRHRQGRSHPRAAA